MRQIPFGKPLLGAEELAAVSAAMESGILAHGPQAERFEKEFAGFTGAPHAVSVGSCTAGLHLVFQHLGIGPGDEVIVPAMTHVATAHAVSYTGARPVFVDAEPATGNIDAVLLSEALTNRTRAIAVVHFLGLPAAMNQILELARPRGLPVIEDCALSLGASVAGVHTGLLGDAGVFSFYPVKHITTAEGGMVITRHEALARSVRSLRAFGMDKHVGERPVPGVYDVLALGYNYRMSEVHAAMGAEQLKRLPAWLEIRRRNDALLRAALADVPEISLFNLPPAGTVSACYCLGVLLNVKLAARRADILLGLKARGVGASVYYPHPVPRLTCYASRYGYSSGRYPVAERIADASIALPVGPHVAEEDTMHIADALKQTLREMR